MVSRPCKEWEHLGPFRRYVACNIFNIVVVGDDDDGTGGKSTSSAKAILDLIKGKVGQSF